MCGKCWLSVRGLSPHFQMGPFLDFDIDVNFDEAQFITFSCALSACLRQERGLHIFVFKKAL